MCRLCDGIDREPLADRGFLVGMPRLEVGANRIAPPPYLVPRVRRHVVDVARAGNRLAEKLRAPRRELGNDRRLGGMHVQVTGAGMVDVFRENPLEHAMQALNARALDVARAPARLEQEQRIGMQRGCVEIVGIRIRDAAHGFGVRLVLLDTLLGIELLHVPHGDRVDECPLFRCRLRVLERLRLLHRGVGVRRLFGVHRGVQVRPPCPRLSPVADGAVRVALPRLAERSDRLGLRKRVHHLEALVEERLRILIR